MPQLLQEFTTSRGIEVRVDPAAGVIHGVKIIGLASLNNRRYLPAALAQAAPLYENTKVNVNHPKGSPLSPRDYQDRIGTLRNVKMRTGEGLFADFHFNPRHALAEQLIWDAQNSPENVGFSHNVLARTTSQDGQLVVQEITRVQSVDLVADPATTRGLFEASLQSTGKHQASSQAAASTTSQTGLCKSDSCGALEEKNDPMDLQHCTTEQLTQQSPGLAEQLTAQLMESVRHQLAPLLEQLQQLIEQQTQRIDAACPSSETPTALSPHVVSREQTFIEQTPVTSDPAAFAKAISI